MFSNFSGLERFRQAPFSLPISVDGTSLTVKLKLFFQISLVWSVFVKLLSQLPISVDGTSLTVKLKLCFQISLVWSVFVKLLSLCRLVWTVQA